MGGVYGNRLGLLKAPVRVPVRNFRHDERLVVVVQHIWQLVNPELGFADIRWTNIRW